MPARHARFALRVRERASAASGPHRGGAEARQRRPGDLPTTSGRRRRPRHRHSHARHHGRRRRSRRGRHRRDPARPRVRRGRDERRTLPRVRARDQERQTAHIQDQIRVPLPATARAAHGPCSVQARSPHRRRHRDDARWHGCRAHDHGRRARKLPLRRRAVRRLSHRRSSAGLHGSGVCREHRPGAGGERGRSPRAHRSGRGERRCGRAHDRRRRGRRRARRQAGARGHQADHGPARAPPHSREQRRRAPCAAEPARHRTTSGHRGPPHRARLGAAGHSDLRRRDEHSARLPLRRAVVGRADGDARPHRLLSRELQRTVRARHGRHHRRGHPRSVAAVSRRAASQGNRDGHRARRLVRHPRARPGRSHRRPRARRRTHREGLELRSSCAPLVGRRVARAGAHRDRRQRDRRARLLRLASDGAEGLEQEPAVPRPLFRKRRPRRHPHEGHDRVEPSARGRHQPAHDVLARAGALSAEARQGHRPQAARRVRRGQDRLLPRQPLLHARHLPAERAGRAVASSVPRRDAQSRRRPRLDSVHPERLQLPAPSPLQGSQAAGPLAASRRSRHRRVVRTTSPPRTPSSSSRRGGARASSQGCVSTTRRSRAGGTSPHASWSVRTWGRPSRAPR